MIDTWFQNYFGRYYVTAQNNLRFGSFLSALTYLRGVTNHNRVLVELGTMGETGDFGAGESTRIFGGFCNEFGGILYSVDINPDAIEKSKKSTIEFSHCIKYYCMEAIDFLESFEVEIDLLYLDTGNEPQEMVSHRLLQLDTTKRNIKDNTVLVIDDLEHLEKADMVNLRYEIFKRGWIEIYRHQQGVYIRDNRNYSMQDK